MAVTDSNFHDEGSARVKEEVDSLDFYDNKHNLHGEETTDKSTLKSYFKKITGKKILSKRKTIEQEGEKIVRIDDI